MYVVPVATRDAAFEGNVAEMGQEYPRAHHDREANVSSSLAKKVIFGKVGSVNRVNNAIPIRKHVMAHSQGWHMVVFVLGTDWFDSRKCVTGHKHEARSEIFYFDGQVGCSCRRAAFLGVGNVNAGAMGEVLVGNAVEDCLSHFGPFDALQRIRSPDDIVLSHDGAKNHFDSLGTVEPDVSVNEE